jgi:integrase
MAHKALAGVYRMAIADELVIRSPTNSVKAPRGGHKERVVPSRGQVLLMVDAAPDPRTRALIAVLAYTGLRISEALSLRWSDWDGRSTLRVTKAKGGRPRAVPVPRALRDHLTHWRTALTAERLASTRWDGSVDWLLPSEAGTQWDPHNARKRFAPIAKATCPGATPHSLRHATATMLLEEGVTIRVVADVLGHSSTRITQDVYSHVTARLTAEAADALDRALGGSGS